MGPRRTRPTRESAEADSTAGRLGETSALTSETAERDDPATTASWAGAAIPRRVPKQAPPDSTLGRLAQNLARIQPADDVDPTVGDPARSPAPGRVGTNATPAPGDEPNSTAVTAAHPSPSDPGDGLTTDDRDSGSTVRTNDAGPTPAGRSDVSVTASSASPAGAAAPGPADAPSGAAATVRDAAGPTPRPSLVTDISEMLSPSGMATPSAAISLPETTRAARPGTSGGGELVDPVALGFPADTSPPRRSRRTRKHDRSGPTRPRRSARDAVNRLVRTVVLLGLIGGLVFAGVTYGPGMYDEYVAKGEPAEPDAPRSFPRGRGGASQIRTATFVLDGASSADDTVDADTTYTVTVDFETDVSRVVVDRTVAPDLEVLTFSDDALIHRVGSDRWYQIERGAFPLDGRLMRSDWIRQIDDVIPPDRRDGVEIEAATVAEVSGVTTRRLVLSIDPTVFEMPLTDTMGMDPISDIADAVDPSGAEPNPAGAAGTDAEVSTTVTDLIRLELWIDGQGVVRRSAGAAALGAADVTILETGSEPWVPDYPSDDQVLPMTAATLLDLGI